MRKEDHQFFAFRSSLFRMAPLILLLILWQLASRLAAPGTLPSPSVVIAAMGAEARSGALLANLAMTLYRVAAAFTLAMILGSLLGVAMGRNREINHFCDPLLIILLNVPALVIIVLAYIWIGLNETAAIGAVTLNKLPNTAAILREGSRALDRELDEMAYVFRLPFAQRLRHVVLPQLMPYIAAAMRSGLSLVWKIVLVVELLGRSNGIGFEIGVAFQLFDVTRLFAYALPFIAIMLAIETFLMQPFERRISRWRRPHDA